MTLIGIFSCLTTWQAVAIITLWHQNMPVSAVTTCEHGRSVRYNVYVHVHMLNMYRHTYFDNWTSLTIVDI